MVGRTLQYVQRGMIARYTCHIKMKHLLYPYRTEATPSSSGTGQRRKPERCRGRLEYMPDLATLAVCEDIWHIRLDWNGVRRTGRIGVII
jgi:hypothetical protein